jgi:hypothetical protein
MRLRNIAFVSCAVVGLAATTTAQQARPGEGRAASKTEAKTVTITGCVAQGIDANHYVLAAAVRRQQPPSAVAEAGTSASVASDKAGASDRTGPYDLEGGEFKGHLGHTVAVTGTSVNTAKATDTTPSESDADKKPLPRFNVVSVKMISATCS